MTCHASEWRCHHQSGMTIKSSISASGTKIFSQWRENQAGKWDGCAEGAGGAMGLRSSVGPILLRVLEDEPFGPLLLGEVVCTSRMPPNALIITRLIRSLRSRRATMATTAITRKLQKAASVVCMR